MKKLFSVLLAAMLVFGLTACGATGTTYNAGDNDILGDESAGNALFGGDSTDGVGDRSGAGTDGAANGGNTSRSADGGNNGNGYDTGGNANTNETVKAKETPTGRCNALKQSRQQTLIGSPRT